MKRKHSEIPWSRIVSLGKALVGTPYVFGAEIDIYDFMKNPDPKRIAAIDCSELIELLYAFVDIIIPDGSYNQAKVCNPITQVKLGDLGFKWNPDTHVIHHVGIYIGDDLVLEAKGKQWGTVLTPIGEYNKSTHFAWWGRHKDVEDA